MEIDDLLDFIEKESGRLRDRHYTLSEDKIILAQAVKMNEEVGELCDAVLSHDSLQREEKLDEFDETEIEDEFADVLITTLLLAKSMDINIEKALDEKIKRIDKRYE